MQYNHAISGVAAASRLSSAKTSKSSSAKATSDEVLLGLISKGDKDAMRVLFARHNLRVYRFLIRMVGNEATAEDLLNEVFVHVWRTADRFEARSQVSTWILGIARYKALTALRSRSFDALDDEVAEAIEDTADDPEVAVQKAERSALLQSCLSQLSSAHRQVVDLVYYHEQSIEEAAQIIGVPQNTVKTRVFHARKRIAELMAAQGVQRAWL
jgi:RNA polymerase sigma-70 factor, ECF subfamily